MTEEVVVRKDDSHKEQTMSLMDYDEGFKPQYRNRNRVQTVSVHVEVPNEVADETPADSVQNNSDNVVAPTDETVQKAGEPKEQRKAADTKKKLISVNRDGAFRIAMLTDTWNQVLKVLGSLVTEARFKWKEDGLYAVAVDPAHVAMCEITIPREIMAEKDIGEGTEFAIDFENFPKLKNGGGVFWMSREGRRNKIAISFNGVAQEVSELDVDSISVPRVPSVESNNRATAEILRLRDFLSTAKDVSDAFRITMTKYGEVKLLAESDTNRAETVLTKDAGLFDIHMSDGGNEVRSAYPLDYVQGLVKAATAVTKIDIALKDDYPLIAELKLPESVKKNKGYYPPGMIPVRYLIAPRMEQ